MVVLSRSNNNYEWCSNTNMLEAREKEEEFLPEKVDSNQLATQAIWLAAVMLTSLLINISWMHSLSTFQGKDLTQINMLRAKLTGE